MHIRPPAVAGLFYPADPQALRAALADCRRHAIVARPPAPLALVAPHAGYIYSGAIAAGAYAQIAPRAERIARIVLLGPAHRVAFSGLAIPEADAFATPLGEVAIDATLRAAARPLPGVVESDVPHATEHALEVQLPFLQTTLEDFTLLPVVVGDAPAATVAAFLDALCRSDDTLIVVSSDLSHFHRYDEARRLDGETARLILSGDEHLAGEQACGARPLNGLARFARLRRWRPRLLAQCNSGDTVGDRQRVVGYAAFAYYDNGDGGDHENLHGGRAGDEPTRH
jgi:AmmeMemoRadiSam system protein B